MKVAGTRLNIREFYPEPNVAAWIDAARQGLFAVKVVKYHRRAFQRHMKTLELYRLTSGIPDSQSRR
jgi:hypothetical protein